MSTPPRQPPGPPSSTPPSLTPVKHPVHGKQPKELLAETHWTSSHDAGTIYLDGTLKWTTEDGKVHKLEDGPLLGKPWRTNGNWVLDSCSVVTVGGKAHIERCVWKVSGEKQVWGHTVEWERVDSHLERGSLKLKRKLDLLSAAVGEGGNFTLEPCVQNHKCSLHGCWNKVKVNLEAANCKLKAVRAVVNDVGPLAKAVDAEFELYDACMSNDAPRQEVRAMIDGEFSLPEGAGSGRLAEFVREGQPSLRAHAETVAKLGGVLGRHLDPEGGFGQGTPFDVSQAPWCHCEMTTIQIIIAFAYLGPSPRVRKLLSALPMREQCALSDLILYLDGGDSVPASSRLHGLRVLCTAQLRCSATKLQA